MHHYTYLPTAIWKIERNGNMDRQIWTATTRRSGFHCRPITSHPLPMSARRLCIFHISHCIRIGHFAAPSWQPMGCCFSSIPLQCLDGSLRVHNFRGPFHLVDNQETSWVAKCSTPSHFIILGSSFIPGIF